MMNLQKYFAINSEPGGVNFSIHLLCTALCYSLHKKVFKKSKKKVCRKQQEIKRKTLGGRKTKRGQCILLSLSRAASKSR